MKKQFWFPSSSVYYQSLPSPPDINQMRTVIINTLTTNKNTSLLIMTMKRITKIVMNLKRENIVQAITKSWLVFCRPFFSPRSKMRGYTDKVASFFFCNYNYISSHMIDFKRLTLDIMQKIFDSGANKSGSSDILGSISWDGVIFSSLVWYHWVPFHIYYC